MKRLNRKKQTSFLLTTTMRSLLCFAHWFSSSSFSPSMFPSILPWILIIGTWNVWLWKVDDAPLFRSSVTFRHISSSPSCSSARRWCGLNLIGRCDAGDAGLERWTEEIWCGFNRSIDRLFLFASSSSNHFLLLSHHWDLSIRLCATQQKSDWFGDKVKPPGTTQTSQPLNHPTNQKPFRNYVAIQQKTYTIKQRLWGRDIGKYLWTEATSSHISFRGFVLGLIHGPLHNIGGKAINYLVISLRLIDNCIIALVVALLSSLAR